MRNFVNLLISWGPEGLFLLSTLDATGVPMVGGVDALLVLLVAVNHDIAYLCAALATVGSLAGSLFLFYLARRGGQVFLDKYTAGGRGARVRAWFQRYGLLTIFVPALIPIPMPLKIPILSAGALKVRPLTFVGVFLAARIPRYAALAYLGLQLGKETLPYLKAHVWHLTGIAVALFAILYLAVRHFGPRPLSVAE